MREGLRSRTRLRNGNGGGDGDGVGDKESGGGGVKSEDFDLGGEGLGVQGEVALDLENGEKDEEVVIVKEECELDLGVNTRGREGADVDFDEDVNNGGCEDDNDAVEGKARKEEEGLNETVLVSGRVLRSRSKRVDEGKSCSEGNGVVVTGSTGRGRGRGRGRGGFGRVAVKKEREEDDEFVPKGYWDERVGLMRKGNTKRNLKRKRGRPPKKQLVEQDELVEHSPRKRGRPRKQNGLPAVAHNREGKGGLRKGKKGSSRRDNANVNAVDDMSSGRSSEGELGKKRFSPVKKNKPGKVLKTEDSGAASPLRSNAVNDTSSRRSSEGELEKKRFSTVKKNKPGKVLKTEDGGVASPLRSNIVNTNVSERSGKNKEKQLVREQIMERLSAAGWTVDYRPRNGKPYNDSVYVSLDGKTHWSITLAYNRLKAHYEAGDGEGLVYGPGFKFIPIPEEDFKILTKVMNKKRKDKGAPKGRKGGKMVDGFNRKLKKEKPGSRAGMSKSVKGKMKRKWSLVEEADSDTSPNRMPDRVRGHKRHKTQNKKRCALLVRNAEVVIDSEVDGYVPYSGKRTVLAWMIDLGTILQNGKVHYMQHRTKNALLHGNITGDGIHCGCCDQIITISEFEAHAESKVSDPLKNIHIEGGTSLLQCLLDSWNKQDESERKGFHFVDVAGEDPNDDSCGVCGDGGDLICCDGCPSTFHQSCLDINNFPSGDWHCIYCCCKFCGSVGGSSNQGEEYDDFSVSTLLTCDLCEEKYHRSCVEANDGTPDESRDACFCGNRCQKLSERLKMLLGVKHEVGDGFSLTFIRRSDVGCDASQTKPQIVECNAKLAVALSVMDECFMPYIDQRSGINLIHSILYNSGSNFKRLNYSGFVTAILARGDEIICAASIRFHGNQLAEMPFIGTRYMYRRKGMCRRLLNAIECALSSLNVELLVIPAISELRETWTSVFGFEPLELTSKKIIRNMSLLVFPHVDLLQKKISKHKLSEENVIPTEVSNLQKNHTEDKVANNCEEAGSFGSDLISCTGIPSSNADQINDKTMSVECHGCLPEGSLNNTPEITSSTVHHHKSPNDVTCQVVFPENLAVEDKSTANPPDHVSDTCDRAKDTSTHNNSSHDCIMQNHDEKPVDLDGQLNNCCITHEERQFLKDGCVSGEAVLTTNALVHLESQNITEDLAVNHEKNSRVVSAPNADEAEACSAETLNLQTNINAEDGQSIVVSSSSSEKIVDGVNENSKPSAVAEANFLPDTDIIAKNGDTVPENEDWMKGCPELAEPDSQVDETARSKAPSLCTPNTGAGMALHCASAGASSTSCGSTEVIVLSNQAS